MRPLDYTPFKIDYLSIAKSLVLSVINKAEYNVFIYGNRASNSNHRFSDLYIGIIGAKPLPVILLTELEEELNNTRIPFKVDVVDFFKVDNAFKNEATKCIIRW